MVYWLRRRDAARSFLSSRGRQTMLKCGWSSDVCSSDLFSLGLLISGPRINLNSYALRARALLARPWSARCYGVARHREGSRQNSIGGSGVLSLRHFGLVLLIRWRVGGEGICRGEIRKTIALLTKR